MNIYGQRTGHLVCCGNTVRYPDTSGKGVLQLRLFNYTWKSAHSILINFCTNYLFRSL